jgi:monolysocardiolipin acyltransferase
MILSACITNISTVANHLSVVDDPTLFGAIPSSYHWPASQSRYALGSHDICFQNAIASAGFRAGQVLPTYRSAFSPYGGPFQPTIDHAVQLLSPAAKPNAERKEGGKWVNIHAEGLTYQTKGVNRVRYFRWGVARPLLEPMPDMPRFVPIFISGFDRVMPDDRTFPKFLPRIGQRVSITFGQEVDVHQRFGDLRTRWLDLVKQTTKGVSLDIGHIPRGQLRDSSEAREIKIECARRIWEEVQTVRLKQGYPPQDARDVLAETWPRPGDEDKPNVHKEDRW